MAPGITLAADVGIIIVFAAILGLLANRFKQPSIVAYIVAGLIIGPPFLGIVTVGELTETMAELGLAFLLFLLGIKMRFGDIRHVLRPIVKISIPQMGLVFLVGAVVPFLLGFSTVEAIVIGLAVMYSSTAVVIKMLTSKDEATSLHGKLDVGILLVQDIAVVILLALLASGQPEGVLDVVTTLGSIIALIAVLGAIAVAMSKFVLPELFRRIAGNPDAFFLIAVSWAFLFVFVADEFDLSIEIGAFLAGLSIAQLPYSKELQGRINPLTDLFVLVFFVSIGLQLEAADLFAHWWEAIVAAIILIPAKFLIFFLLIHWQGFDLETSFLGSANMVQVSEFGLILGSVGVAGGFIGEPILGFLSLLALMTMAVSVYVIQFNRRLYTRLRPILGRWFDPESRDIQETPRGGHAIIVGYDEFAHETAQVLEQYYDVLFVDRNPDTVEALKEEGFEVLFGDFRHEAIRREAGLSRASFVLSCSVQRDVNMTLLAEAATDTTVFVEAEYDAQAREYYERGAHYVILSAQLAVDQLVEYLDTYLDTPAAFDEVIEADVSHLLTRPIEETEGGGELS